MSSIEATHLSKRFGNLTVLNNISLNVSKGEFFGLFGSNGAGKTTLLRILTGQLSADSGEVRTAGYSISDPISIKRSVGIVPEAESPPTFLTAREALELSCLLRNLNNVNERVDRWLDFFDLQEKSDVLCRDLSKGQRQKLMLTSAFIHEPSLLFLDEAFINLDPIYQRRLRGYLKSLVEEGRTIFMCTHILEIAEKLCSRVAVIDKGSIVAQGSIDELRSQEGEDLEEIFIRTVKNENAHLP
ncbi:ABC transporter ATP-binding protein [Candidatus Bathyarchaeota archaeon RBG_13_52_12]|nr:MAG: ABC transporter ATP-binding protein [Candidatus Bathyarchaeota archaeon RBG_13_52_12]